MDTDSKLQRAYYISNCIERLMMVTRERIEAGDGAYQRRMSLWIAEAICEGKDRADVHQALAELLQREETPRPLTWGEDRQK